MIVRVLGQGQWVLEVEDIEKLNVLDEKLEQAVKDDDEPALADVLQQLFEMVKDLGEPVPDDVIVESDLVLPDTDTSLEEVRLLLDSTSEYVGLIPDGEPAGDVEKEPEAN